MAAELTNNLVHGVAPVLQTLKRLEPETYKAIEKQLKSDAQPLRAAVAAGFPSKPWQSSKPVNWTIYGRTTRGRKVNPDAAGASFPQYNSRKVRSGVRVVIGGRKVHKGKNAGAYPIMRIRQSDAAGSIFDLASKNRSGSKAGEQFVSNLAKTGAPSRVMWKKVKENFFIVENSINKTINEIEKRFTLEIANETDKRARQSKVSSSQSRNVLGQFGKALR
jgi:hypothetical protein